MRRIAIIILVAFMTALVPQVTSANITSKNPDIDIGEVENNIEKTLLEEVEEIEEIEKEIGYYQIIKDEMTSKNSIINALKAAEYLNTYIVQPEETFSYNKVVGERIEERGFLPGPYAIPGGESGITIGGGVCITAGILHQAVKSAGLRVIERNDHVNETTYLPLGEDAAIVWGSQDYQFENSTELPIKITAGEEDGVIFVRLENVYPAKPVYLEEKLIGNCINIDDYNYIKVDKLGKEIETEEEWITVKQLAEYLDCYTQWKEDGVYLTSSKPIIRRETIGYSTQDRNIEAVYLEPPKYNKTIIATFALHGFEGKYDYDGQALVQIAEKIIESVRLKPEVLNCTRIIIIPCSNPDGAYAGYTEEGFGRCNAEGIDLNRDFDYNWEFISEPRYLTGSVPFSATESQIIRDIILKEKPDIVLDFHGWLDCCYGDSDLQNIFTEKLELGTPKPADYTKYKPMQGYLIGWASQYARTALIEYKFTEDIEGVANKTLEIICKL